MTKHFFLSMICLLLLANTSSATVFSSEALFQQNQQRLFQIKLIDKKTDSRSSIGSGFIVNDGYTLATNYHVISSAIKEPDKFNLVSVNSADEENALEIIAIDIVNDLALLKSNHALGEPLALSTTPPAKGAIIYAMGNPHDLGTTLVQGTYNGLAETTFYKRIHFSGSINSGMSGGPAFNQQGEVIGINVSSAGDQLSFLVPVDKLTLLLTKLPLESDSLDFQALSQQQLKASQNRLINAILSKQWPTDQLGEAQVIGDLPGLVKCWGQTTEREPDEFQVHELNKGCSLQDSIYINRRTSTGSLHYQFFWIDGETISERKFFRHLQNDKMSWSPDNRTHKDDATPFKCDESIIDTGHKNETAKAFYCARRYIKFPELYDVMYVQLRKRGQKSLVSHFTLAGVTQASADTFRAGFTRNVKWP